MFSMEDQAADDCLSSTFAPQVYLAFLTALESVEDSNESDIRRKLTRYFARHITLSPWANHLGLAFAVSLMVYRDLRRAMRITKQLHRGLSTLKTLYGLRTMNEQDVNAAFALYIHDHQSSCRHDTGFRFGELYLSVATLVEIWQEEASPVEQLPYRPFVLPKINAPNIVVALDASMYRRGHSCRRFTKVN